MTDAQRRAKKAARQRAWIRANPGYKAQWRKRNLEKARKSERDQSRSYRARFPNRVRAWNKADRLRRRTRVRAAAKRYYQENKDRIKAKTTNWKIANPERKKELHRAYKKRHPEKVAEQQFRRRVRKLGAVPHDCTERIKVLKKAKFCHWCCQPISSLNLEIDHVTPLSRGGQHISDNLAASCESCNRSKGNKMVHEWTWKEAA